MDATRFLAASDWELTPPRDIVPFVKPTSSERKLLADAVLIDACGVLYDGSHWRRWLYQLLSRLGVQTQYVAFYRVWEHEYLPQVKCGRANFRDALRSFLLSAGMWAGQVDEVVFAVNARARAFDSPVRLLSGVRRTLDVLQARGLRLAALVGTPDMARQFDQLGLADRFEHVFRETELATGNAARRTYASNLPIWAGPHDNVVVVSRDPWELEQAAAAGLPAVAVNYEGSVTADVHLEHFGQLPDFLASEGFLHRIAG